MSRSTKKNRGRRGVAWPLLAFGAILLLGAAVLFAVQRNGGSSGGAARIAVEPQMIDYGYVKFGTDETFRIKVTNTGTGTLKFAEAPYIEVLEGC